MAPLRLSRDGARTARGRGVVGGRVPHRAGATEGAPPALIRGCGYMNGQCMASVYIVPISDTAMMHARNESLRGAVIRSASTTRHARMSLCSSIRATTGTRIGMCDVYAAAAVAHNPPCVGPIVVHACMASR